MSERFDELPESNDWSFPAREKELHSELFLQDIAENEQENLEILTELGEHTTDANTPEEVILTEDELLCQSFIAGDDAAFVQLYAKYETPVLLYCRRMMYTDKLAEDAFQDVWVRIFDLRSRGSVITNFRALLFRSARNLCLNTLRLERYRSGSSEALKGLKAIDESSHDIEQEEIKTLITRALSKLPFDQREAFVLHEYSGYSYHEIAQMMGAAEPAVKVRAFRARLRLRKLIASWLGLAEDDDPSNAI